MKQTTKTFLSLSLFLRLMANSVRSNVLNFGVAIVPVPGIETLKCNRSKHHEQECFYFGMKCFSCGKDYLALNLRLCGRKTTVVLLRIKQRAIEISLLWDISVLAQKRKGKLACLLTDRDPTQRPKDLAFSLHEV